MQPIHLHNESEVSRYQVTTRLFALSETDMPKGKGLPQNLLEIAKYLNPELSPRYGKTTVFSHIYAYDFCYLAGCYLPRVWHRDVNFVENGICDMGATDQYHWLKTFGKDFGWNLVADVEQAKELAEVGHVVIIAATPKSTTATGLVTIVLPEARPNIHRADKGFPAQTRAGKNFFYSNWYEGRNYSDYKIYVNYLK